MALTQKTIFIMCIATVYGAVITDISREESDGNASKNYLVASNDAEFTEYNSQNPSFIVSGEIQSQYGFQMGKSFVEALLSVLQIVRHMDLSEQGLKNVSLLVTRMASHFAGQYFETLRNLLPMFSGMALAILESLK